MIKTYLCLLLLFISTVCYADPTPLEPWSINAGDIITGSDGPSQAQTGANPELQHYDWDASMTGGDCGYCHVPEGAFLQAGYRKDSPGFCGSCHNAGGTGHEKNLSGRHGHGLFVNATAAGRKKPTYGNITAGEYNDQPSSRLKGGHLVVCVTCHNAMRKPDDPGRTWEFTTTTDNLTYSLWNGGWSGSGYLTPVVYRDTSLWAGPTYSKDKKNYLVDPSEYAYNEEAGTISFRTQQPAEAYIYASLDYPYLRAPLQNNSLCADCHTEATHRDNNCLVCHRAHNTDNIAGIREKVRTPNYSSVSVRFVAYTGAGSFADGGPVRDGICEVCHTQTKYYRLDGSGFANHSGGLNYDRTDCTACHSHAAGITKAGYIVRIDSPFNNSTSHESSATVYGTIIGRENAEVGVTVNGQLAAVNGASFALADLPLTDGENTITAAAMDANGMAASDSITITVVNPANPQVSISVSPASGTAPVEVTFTVDSTVADAASFELDFGDKSEKATAATLDDLRQAAGTHTYSRNGLFSPAFTVTDGAGGKHKKSAVVNLSPPPDLGSKWGGMRAALLAGDVNKAVTFFSPTTRESYKNNLATLSQMVPGSLQTVVADMSNMTIYETGDTYALGEFSITRNGSEISFEVHFIKDADGIWRIETF